MAQLERERSARLDEFAKTPPVCIKFDRVPDAPEGDPVELPNVYHHGDRVTLRRLDVSANLSYYETSVEDMQKRRVRDLYGLTYDVTMVDREGETVVEVDRDQHVHEGRYDVKSYIVHHRPIVETLIQIEAKFRTDRRGRLVPGTFWQTDGPPLVPTPQFIGDRHFGVLPDHSVRHGQPGETWGTEALPNPFAKYVIIDGRPLPSLPLQRRREGGWRITGGELTKEHDGRWTRNSSYDLKLRAVENGWLKNTTYKGQPADISYGVEWKGSAIYMLLKQFLVRVDDLAVDIEVRVKTATMLYEWRGHSSLNFEMFKDP
ncbi:MAG: hypothetical protein ACYS99_23005 [Planctomycetota bacterium]